MAFINVFLEIKIILENLIWSWPASRDNQLDAIKTGERSSSLSENRVNS